VTLYRSTREEKNLLKDLAEYTEFQTPIERKATAYVCQDYTCQAPTTDIQHMLKLLKGAV
jgi:uncharacterized protein YyaL (SSP411 family)